MNKILFLIFILLLCKPDLSLGQGQNYRDKYKTIESLKGKYPEEVKFANDYLKLTEDTVDLIDSLLADFMKSTKQEAFIYFSNDNGVDEVYKRLKEMHFSGLAKIQDPKRGDLLKTKLQSVADAKDFQEWATITFRNKSQIESLAALRQIQTNCFEVIDIVFDDMILALKN